MLANQYSSASHSGSDLFLLHVTCQEHRFCLPLDEVERLLLLMEIQSIPQAPDYLIGLMNLYGEAVPVIDLALRVGLNHQPRYTLQTPLVLVKSGSDKAAIIIDNIEGVQAANPEQLRGEKLFLGGLPPLKASVTYEQGTSLLLDMQRILALDLSELSGPLELGEELLSLCRIQSDNNRSEQVIAQQESTETNSELGQ